MKRSMANSRRVVAVKLSDGGKVTDPYAAYNLYLW
jgi:hypothetical protein